MHYAHTVVYNGTLAIPNRQTQICYQVHPSASLRYAIDFGHSLNSKSCVLLHGTPIGPGNSHDTVQHTQNKNCRFVSPKLSVNKTLQPHVAPSVKCTRPSLRELSYQYQWDDLMTSAFTIPYIFTN